MREYYIAETLNAAPEEVVAHVTVNKLAGASSQCVLLLDLDLSS